MHRNLQPGDILILNVEGNWISISVAYLIIFRGNNIAARQRVWNSELSVGIAPETTTQMSGVLTICTRGDYLQPNIRYGSTIRDSDKLAHDLALVHYEFQTGEKTTPPVSPVV